MKKFKKKDEIDISDLLLHAMQYLDKAAELAEDQEDVKALLKVHKQSLKASDRIMSVFMNMEQGGNNEPIGTHKGNFGFGVHPESECELEEDSE